MNRNPFFDDVNPFFYEPPNPLNQEEEITLPDGRVLIKRGPLYFDKATGKPAGLPDMPGALNASSPEADKIINGEPNLLQKAVASASSAPVVGWAPATQLANQIVQNPIGELEKSLGTATDPEEIKNALKAGALDMISIPSKVTRWGADVASKLAETQSDVLKSMGLPTSGLDQNKKEIDWLANMSKEEADKFNARRAELTGRDPSLLNQAIAQGPQMALQMTAAAINPLAGSLLMGGQTLGTSYEQKRAAGSDVLHAAGWAVPDAVIQGYLENKLPTKIVDDLAKHPDVWMRMKAFLPSSALEAGTEGLQAYSTVFTDLLAGKYGEVGSKGFKKDQFLADINPMGENIFPQMAVGAITGGATHALTHGGAEVMGRLGLTNTAQVIGPDGLPTITTPFSARRNNQEYLDIRTGSAGEQLVKAKQQLNAAINAGDTAAQSSLLDEIETLSKEFNSRITADIKDPLKRTPALAIHSAVVNEFNKQTTLDVAAVGRFQDMFGAKETPEGMERDPESGLPKMLVDAAAIPGNEEGMKALARSTKLYKGAIGGLFSMYGYELERQNGNFDKLVEGGQAQEEQRAQWVSDSMKKNPNQFVSAVATMLPDPSNMVQASVVAERVARANVLNANPEHADRFYQALGLRDVEQSGPALDISSAKNPQRLLPLPAVGDRPALFVDLNSLSQTEADRYGEYINAIEDINDEMKSSLSKRGLSKQVKDEIRKQAYEDTVKLYEEARSFILTVNPEAIKDDTSSIIPRQRFANASEIKQMAQELRKSIQPQEEQSPAEAPAAPISVTAAPQTGAQILYSGTPKTNGRIDISTLFETPKFTDSGGAKVDTIISNARRSAPNAIKGEAESLNIHQITKKIIENTDGYDTEDFDALYALMSGPEEAHKSADKIEKLLNKRGFTLGSDLGNVVNVSRRMSTAPNVYTLFAQSLKAGIIPRRAAALSYLMDGVLQKAAGDAVYTNILDYFVTSPLGENKRGKQIRDAVVPGSRDTASEGILVAPSLGQVDYTTTPGKPTVSGAMDATSATIHEFAHFIEKHLTKLVDVHALTRITKYFGGKIGRWNEIENTFGEAEVERFAEALQIAIDRLKNQEFASQALRSGLHPLVLRALTTASEAQDYALSGKFTKDASELDDDTALAFLSIFNHPSNNMKKLSQFAKHNIAKIVENGLVHQQYRTSEITQEEAEDALRFVLRHSPNAAQAAVTASRMLGYPQNPPVDTELLHSDPNDNLTSADKIAPQQAQIAQPQEAMPKQDTPVQEVALQQPQQSLPQAEQAPPELPVIGPPPSADSISMDDPADFIEEASGPETPIDEVSIDESSDDGDGGKKYTPPPLGWPAKSRNHRWYERINNWRKAYIGYIDTSQMKGLRFWQAEYKNDKTGAARMMTWGRDMLGKRMIIPPNIFTAAHSFTPGGARDLVMQIEPMLKKAGMDIDEFKYKINKASQNYLEAIYKFAADNDLDKEGIPKIKEITYRARVGGDIQLISQELQKMAKDPATAGMAATQVQEAWGGIAGILEDMTLKLTKSGLLTKDAIERYKRDLYTYLHRDYRSWHAKDWANVALSDTKTWQMAWDRAMEIALSHGYENTMPQGYVPDPNKAEQTPAEAYAEGIIQSMVENHIEPMELKNGVGGGAGIVQHMDQSEMMTRLGKLGKDWVAFREEYRRTSEKARKEYDLETKKLSEGKITERSREEPIQMAPTELFQLWIQQRRQDTAVEGQRKGWSQTQLEKSLKKYDRMSDNLFNIMQDFPALNQDQVIYRTLDEEDMPDVFRKLKGEIQDPVHAARLSAIHMAHDIAYAEFWRKLRAQGLKTGLFVPVKQGDHQHLVSMSRRTTLDPLQSPVAGMAESEDIAGDTPLYSTKDTVEFLNAVWENRKNSTLATAMSIWKYGKVLSPGPMSRNALSVLFSVPMNGHATAGMAAALLSPEGFHALHTSIAAMNQATFGGGATMGGKVGKGMRKMTEAMRHEPTPYAGYSAEYWTDLLFKHGISQPGVDKELVIDLMNLESFASNNPDEFKFWSRKNAAFLGSLAGRLYNATDVFQKNYGFVAESNELRWYNAKGLRNMAPMDDSIAREAARVTLDTYQNYDNLPQFVKDFSKMGTFASFQWEMTRNLYNSLARGVEWGKESQKQFAAGNYEKGVKAAALSVNRLAATVLVGISFGAIEKWLWGVATRTANMVGINAMEFGDEITDAFMRAASYRGSEYATPIIVGRKGSQITYFDTSNQNPYQFYDKMVNVLSDGTQPNMSDRFVTLLSQAQQNFLPPPLWYKTLIEGATGKDVNNTWVTGRRYEITGTQEVPFVELPTKLETRLTRLKSNVAFTAWNDLIEGGARATSHFMKDELGIDIGIKDQKGSRVFTPSNYLFSQAGLQMKTADIEIPLVSKSGEFRDQLNDMRQDLNNRLRKLGATDLKGRFDAINRAEKQWQKLYADYSSTLRDFDTLGLDYNKIQLIMKSTGLKKSTRDNLLYGIYTPWDDVWEEKEPR